MPDPRWYDRIELARIVREQSRKANADRLARTGKRRRRIGAWR